MNREAVALGTPVYTIFSGRMGAVDERLIADGRLRVLTTPPLELRKRDAKRASGPRDPQLLVDGSSRPSGSLAREPCQRSPQSRIGALAPNSVSGRRRRPQVIS